jgi:pyruvate dehydrogenase E1 component alpha subunit/2-oxoisovalerate dehydrogenase E1 component alpha subunit
MKTSPLGRDCLKLAEEELLRRQWGNAETLAAWRGEAAQKVEEAVAVAQREPGPDPFKENWSAISSAHLNDGFKD